jgi:hypothetical protein
VDDDVDPWPLLGDYGLTGLGAPSRDAEDVGLGLLIQARLRAGDDALHAGSGRGDSSSYGVGALRQIGGGGGQEATDSNVMGARGIWCAALGDSRGVQASSLCAHDNNAGRGNGANIGGEGSLGGAGRGSGSVGVLATDAKGTDTIGGSSALASDGGSALTNGVLGIVVHCNAIAQDISDTLGAAIGAMAADSGSGHNATDGDVKGATGSGVQAGGSELLYTGKDGSSRAISNDAGMTAGNDIHHTDDAILGDGAGKGGDSLSTGEEDTLQRDG